MPPASAGDPGKLPRVFAHLLLRDAFVLTVFGVPGPVEGGEDLAVGGEGVVHHHPAAGFRFLFCQFFALLETLGVREAEERLAVHDAFGGSDLHAPGRADHRRPRGNSGDLTHHAFGAEIAPDHVATDSADERPAELLLVGEEGPGDCTSGCYCGPAGQQVPLRVLLATDNVLLGGRGLNPLPVHVPVPVLWAGRDRGGNRHPVGRDDLLADGESVGEDGDEEKAALQDVFHPVFLSK